MWVFVVLLSGLEGGFLVVAWGFAFWVIGLFDFFF